VPIIPFEIFRAIEAAEKAFSGRGDPKGRPGERGLEDSGERLTGFGGGALGIDGTFFN
jgi:hypothetical protein